MGGVPKRFPQLKFAFLEGGVAWARNLYCDLVSHWEKRNREALENYNPAHINTAEFIELAARYGGRRVAGRAETLIADHQDRTARGEDAASFDEWAPSGIGSAAEICEIFTQRFYFGCEGDDPLNALASDTKGSPFHAKLHALYGSESWPLGCARDGASGTGGSRAGRAWCHQRGCLPRYGLHQRGRVLDLGESRFLQRHGGANGRGFIIGKRLLETAVVGSEPGRGVEISVFYVHYQFEKALIDAGFG